MAIRWRRGWARVVAAGLMAVWIAWAGWSAWGQRGEAAGDAVVTADELVVREADSAGAGARLAQPLPAGTEVTITRQRDGWARVRLSDGRDGVGARLRVDAREMGPPTAGSGDRLPTRGTPC